MNLPFLQTLQKIEMAQTKQGIIKVSRPDRWFAKFRAFAIFLDGRKVGKIRDKETATIPVPPGIHTIWVKIDFISSNRLQVDAEKNETISLVIERPPRRGWKYWGTLIYFGLFLAIANTLRGPFFLLFLAIAGIIPGLYYSRTRIREI